MATNWVSTILENGIDRAFPNLYDVSITRSGVDSFFSKSPYLAERVDFGQFQFLTDFNTALQAHTFKDIDKLKSVNISFRETSQFSVIQAIKGWMNEIYDFDKNQFKAFSAPATPYGTLVISLDDPSSGFSIILEEAMPTSLDYPSFAWDDANPLKVQVTFSFNKVHLKTGIIYDPVLKTESSTYV